MLGRRILHDTIFPQFETKTTLTAAQAAGIFVTEFDVLPAIPGYLTRPILFHVNKEAGAYTIAGVTALQLINGTIADNFPQMGIAPSGFLDSASDITFANVLKGNGLSADFGVMNISIATNKKLALRTTGAALSGAGGNLNVTVIYTLIPVKYAFPSA